MNVGRLIGNHQFEVTLFQNPFAIIAYKSQIFCPKFKGYRLTLSRLKGHLFKCSEATAVGHHTGYQVAAIEKHAFLACHFARVFDINRNSENVVVTK